MKQRISRRRETKPKTSAPYRVNLNGALVEAASVHQAAWLLCSWRDANDYTASDFDEGCGDVTLDGQLVARVSYNGRIWNEDGTERVMP